MTRPVAEKHTPATAAEIRSAWEALNGVPDVGTQTDECGRFLLAFAAVGARSIYALAELSGLNVFTASRLKSKAERLGLLHKGKLQHSGWLDDEKGGVAFILDVMTLEGTMERLPS